MAQPCLQIKDLCKAPGEDYLLISDANGVYGHVDLATVLVGGNADGYLDGVTIDQALQQVSFSLSSGTDLDAVDFSVFAFDNELADIATSGDYNDLVNRPTLSPSGGNITGNINLNTNTFTLNAVNSGGISYYDSGFGFWVYGSPGVVTTNVSGVYTMSFPTGANIHFWYKQFGNVSETQSGTVIVNQNWNTSSFNTSFANALAPTYSMIWEDVNGEQYPPQNTDTSPSNANSTGTTIVTDDVQNGIVTTLITNITNAIPISVKASY